MMMVKFATLTYVRLMEVFAAKYGYTIEDKVRSGSKNRVASPPGIPRGLSLMCSFHCLTPPTTSRPSGGVKAACSMLGCSFARHWLGLWRREPIRAGRLWQRRMAPSQRSCHPPPSQILRQYFEKFAPWRRGKKTMGSVTSFRNFRVSRCVRNQFVSSQKAAVVHKRKHKFYSQ